MQFRVFANNTHFHVGVCAVSVCACACVWVCVVCVHVRVCNSAFLGSDIRIDKQKDGKSDAFEKARPQQIRNLKSNSSQNDYHTTFS